MDLLRGVLVVVEDTAVGAAALSALRGDEDYTVSCLDTVDGCGCSILQ